MQYLLTYKYVATAARVIPHPDSKHRYEVAVVLAEGTERVGLQQRLFPLFVFARVTISNRLQMEKKNATRKAPRLSSFKMQGMQPEGSE